jgi:hypothetical protein
MKKTDSVLAIRRRMHRHYTRMLRILTAGCAVLAIVQASPARAADVVPANTAIVFLRADPSEIVTNGPFYKGATLLLTNCIFYAGTSTNAGVQDLTSCSITCKVGTTTSALITTNGTIQSAAAGTWWTRFTVPTNLDNSAIFQATIYDANGNSYTYNWKVIPVRGSL